MVRDPGPAPRSDRRRLLRTGMVVLAVPVLAGPARAAQILAVRVWPADEYTRITIESDGALVQRHFLAEGPDRLVIEIDGLELDATLRELVGKVRADMDTYAW